MGNKFRVWYFNGENLEFDSFYLPCATIKQAEELLFQEGFDASDIQKIEKID